MYKHFFKRFLDFWTSLIVLILISPILLVITIWLHFANKGAGAFFFQERPGKDAKIFKVIKFKTMTDERDAEGNLLPDEQRLTKVGKFVRSTSIDELPQLVNRSRTHEPPHFCKSLCIWQQLSFCIPLVRHRLELDDFEDLRVLTRTFLSKYHRLQPSLQPVPLACWRKATGRRISGNGVRGETSCTFVSKVQPNRHH